MPTATLLLDGRVLIAGDRTAELFDPRSGQFTRTGDLKVERIEHSATRLPDGRVLIAGGGFTRSAVGAISFNASAEIYDPATGTFAFTSDMDLVRRGNRGTLLANGKVLITGGAEPFHDFNRRAMLFDPASETFSPTGEMVSGQFYHTATLLSDGRVLLTNGSYGGDPSDFDWVRPEIYDPATGVFFPLPEMAIPGVHFLRATLLPNGKVLLSGGWRYDGQPVSAELFDPATGRFSPSSDTKRPLGPTATLLSDGTVFLGNGEIYDPATDRFSGTGEGTNNRFNQVATLLADGAVLLTYYSNAVTPTGLQAIYTPVRRLPPPALFTLPSGTLGQGAILHADTHLPVGQANPAVAGEALEIYLTGLLDGSVIPPQVSIGGRLAEVLYFGRAPGLANINQINVRVPAGIAPGPTVSVRLTYIGRPSNEVTIAVQ